MEKRCAAALYICRICIPSSIKCAAENVLPDRCANWLSARALQPPALQPPSRTAPSGRCPHPHDAYFLAVMAVFLAPRSFLTRFFRSFMFLRDLCTLVSSPFCGQHQQHGSGPEAWAQRDLLRASGMRAAVPDVASPFEKHAAHTAASARCLQSSCMQTF
jgi:hypothetical protein